MGHHANPPTEGSLQPIWQGSDRDLAQCCCCGSRHSSGPQRKEARTGVQARGCVRRAALTDLGHPAHDAGERSVTERWSAQAAARSRSSASAAGISSRPSAWRRQARARQTTSATTRHGCGSGTSRSATHTELPLRRGTVTSTTLVRERASSRSRPRRIARPRPEAGQFGEATPRNGGDGRWSSSSCARPLRRSSRASWRGQAVVGMVISALPSIAERADSAGR